MGALIALSAAFFVGMLVCIKTKRELFSWLVSSAVVPAFVLSAEFLLPYQGGGASMWTLALIVGGVVGSTCGAIGVWLASWLNNRESPHQ